MSNDRLLNETVEHSGQRWLVREAKDLIHAEGEIAIAIVRGSVGGRSILDQTLCGGGIEVLADVVQLNADGTERRPS